MLIPTELFGNVLITVRIVARLGDEIGRFYWTAGAKTEGGGCATPKGGLTIFLKLPPPRSGEEASCHGAELAASEAMTVLSLEVHKAIGEATARYRASEEAIAAAELATQRLASIEHV